jgi:hypothetical protein
MQVAMFFTVSSAERHVLRGTAEDLSAANRSAEKILGTLNQYK